MAAAWTVRDRDGQLLRDFLCASPQEVGRKLVPRHYDAFRLLVSHSYREAYEHALRRILEREGWQIVRVDARSGYKVRSERRAHR